MPAKKIPKENKTKPIIDTGVRDLTAQVETAWGAVLEENRREPALFLWGGRMARVVADPAGPPRLEPIREGAFRNLLDRAVDWVRSVGTGRSARQEPDYPPKTVVQAMMDDPQPDVPVIRRIVSAPVFASDGSLVATTGYHSGAGVWLDGSYDLRGLPERPTPSQVEAAVNLLTGDLLGEFPFRGRADLAHAVAMAVLPHVRPLIQGPTPLHLVDAISGPGTGKDLLVSVLTVPFLGRPVAAKPVPADEPEFRKTITASLRGSASHVLFGNVPRRLDSAALANALTAGFVADRLLGSSTELHLPVDCVWAATGNGVRTSKEIARRTVRIELDAGVEQPWLRTDFRHPNLLEWATGNRHGLLAAVLTLIRAWVAEGMPRGAATLGSFEVWARVVGGVLEVAGIPGFLGNLQETYEEVDEETGSWRSLLKRWEERFGGEPVTTADLYELTAQDEVLQSVLLGNGSERSRRIRLGKGLAKLVYRQIGSYRVASAPGNSRTGAQGYRLQRT